MYEIKDTHQSENLIGTKYKTHPRKYPFLFLKLEPLQAWNFKFRELGGKVLNVSKYETFHNYLSFKNISHVKKNSKLIY